MIPRYLDIWLTMRDILSKRGIHDEPDFFDTPDYIFADPDYETIYFIQSELKAHEQLGFVPPLYEALKVSSDSGIMVPGLTEAFGQTYFTYINEDRKKGKTKAQRDHDAYERYCDLFERWLIIWNEVIDKRTISAMGIKDIPASRGTTLKEVLENLVGEKDFEIASEAIIEMAHNSPDTKFLRKRDRGGNLTDAIITPQTLMKSFDEFRTKYDQNGWVYAPCLDFTGFIKRNDNPHNTAGGFYFRSPWVFLAFTEIVRLFRKPSSLLTSLKDIQKDPNFRKSAIFNNYPVAMDAALQLAQRYYERKFG
ncbi:hypothetical protein [Terasakiella sp. SH-1]|uniref:hypothetical protein n=1 Tax=Terasakiella sp. SH-1 TaxID=2560057 RepID=UPI00107446D7|nr:hypothetical protein [Terasakiella sp. SH-1]